MKYAISDTHFGHKGSLNWPNGNAREFTDINEMNQTIIDNWNSIITDEDTVYMLGDFAYKASNATIKHIFKSLKGKIILIKGNHDGQTLKTNQKEHRFESVHDILEFEYNDKQFVLCHYPIQSWRLKERGSIHLHGHTHKTIPNITGNIMNMSCEVINYTPVLLDDIINKFNKK
jgi:calcineurin-like phosphoesterase family protein